MATTLTPLERSVLKMLLAGEWPVLAVLRHQSDLASVVKREFTGVGFMTSLSVPPGTARASVPGVAQFGDVVAAIEGAQGEAGFLLYVRGGQLDALEGYTFDGPWPDEPLDFRLRYVNPLKREFGNLLP